MSLRPHENVRIKVASLLRELLKEVAERRYNIAKDLHSYTLLKLLEPGRITVLMPQEVRVGDEKRWIDMALGSNIVFELKSNPREFVDAEKDAKEKYWSIVSRARFFITTNWDKWRMYNVTEKGLELIGEYDEGKAIEILRTQVIPQIKELKIPPIPENVEVLYKLDYEELHKKLLNVFNTLRADPRVKPLYEAYKSIMSMLYGGMDEEFYTDLFVRHTYMQIVVLTSLASALGVTESPERLCSGAFLEIDIALPYLNWWRVALYDKALKDQVEDILRAVIGRAYLVDWSLGVEDVFRMLYEFLVERKIRREIGEYYTPVWLVELMLYEFDLRDKVVLDPFCGSGTFLVKAFHRKVDGGESPDKALNEVLGFDINPLAVSVARAELIIAYWRRVGKLPEYPPLIYHIDTLAMWFGGSAVITTPSLAGLIDSCSLLNFSQVKQWKGSDILNALRIIERVLMYSIRFAYRECERRRSRLDAKCLEEEISRNVETGLKDSKEPFIQVFLKHFKEHTISRAIAHVISSHGGNDVWSFVVASVYASVLMSNLKPDIIVTNPPWITITKPKTPYINKIKEYLVEYVKKAVRDKRKVGNILTGADIATAALGKSIELAKGGVAYVMNRDQLFNYKASVSAGVLTTYLVLKGALASSKAKVKLVDFDFDVFEHGINPAIVVVKKEQGDIR